ncbi:MAG: right-handed parallel beta-helix repeat-containing protein [Candidatus Hodarchaeales archaeon]|jgi:parallel beta-helix repeat protein
MRKIVFIVLISLFLLNTTVVDNNHLDHQLSPRSNLKVQVSSDEHDPIVITDNYNFSDLDFPGNGTFNNPYIIEGYSFAVTTNYMISIHDTTAHFVIKDNVIDGMHGNTRGILLTNTTHGMIENNTIINCQYGITMQDSSNNTVKNNEFHDNHEYGIYVFNSSHNEVFNNNFVSNSIGLFLSYSIVNKIYDNTVFNSSGYAVFIDFDSSANILTWNDFAYNNLSGGKGQVWDDGISTVFISNYWHDWASFDNDNDGAIDAPYSIPGFSNSQDKHPRVLPNRQITTSYIDLMKTTPTNAFGFEFVILIPSLGLIGIFTLITRKRKNHWS